jgi:hypothetical protein
MIRITIEKIETVRYCETKSFCVTEKPTELVEPKEYGSGNKIAYDRTYETREVPMQRQETTKILTQEIAEDSSFNLPAVIIAINNLTVKLVLDYGKLVLRDGKYCL